ncbi:MAG: OHCU decarboxylase [Chloroflexota bacterium]
MTHRWSLAEVNTWDRATFVARLGWLFEGSPWIVEAVWEARPFADLVALHRALIDVVHDAGEERQLALIRAHPDLVGRAALTGSLSRESTAEQRAAGLDPGALTAEEIARFTELNAAYRQKFSFPFVICAREHTKATILAAFESRLHHSPEEEIATALGEIAKIAWYRLVDAVAEHDA